MRTNVCLALLALPLILLPGCKEGKRYEPLEGTWQAINASGTEKAEWAEEFSKLRVTFGPDGEYSMTATCDTNATRAGPNYTCDDTKPIATTYKIRKVERDRVVELVVQPGANPIGVNFPPDKPGHIQLQLWPGVGDRVLLKKVE